MTVPNEARVLVSLLGEIAVEEGYTLTSFSHDWILRLEKGAQARHIFGYNFEINSASAHMLAADKAATSDLLAHADVPRVEHKLFLHPKLAGYVSSAGNWESMQAYAKEHSYPLVVKPNEGTGGRGLYMVENALELEQSVHSLFKKQRGICLSPFLEIEQEFRVILLDEEALLIYAKKRPRIIGDGRATVLELIEGLHQSEQLSQSQLSRIIDDHAGDLTQVLDKGDELLLGWKHNLGAGAQPLLVEDEALAAELGQLAQRARQTINIRFASIDIIRVAGEYSVLEINSGVMLEHFTHYFPDQRARVKEIYAAAVAKMFASP